MARWERASGRGLRAREIYTGQSEMEQAPCVGAEQTVQVVLKRRTYWPLRPLLR